MLRIRPPVVATVLIHALLAALVIGEWLPRTAPPPPASMTMVNVAGVADGAAAEPVEAPPPPIELVPPPALPMPTIEIAAPPTPMAAALTSAAASPAAAPMPAAAAPTPTASAAPTPLAPRLGTPEGARVKARHGIGNDYAGQLRAWLIGFKIYPKRSRMRREEGIVHVQFVIDRAGRLVSGTLVRSSGFEVLDREVMAMLQRAIPFPAAPEDVSGDKIEISAAIEFALTA